MLSESEQRLSYSQAAVSPPSPEHRPIDHVSPPVWTRLLRLEWLGQMVASLCWIASVFSYGISSMGDWLQLAAAGSWLVANLASVTSAEGG